ncbi:KRRI-Interacting protein 1 [Coelomomyces lativittatus]|nr:KRRI-Interacting protein 1 [Coelomomyces lativittatus]KAJ1508990.1 KRRI-Interacting protein 1 [Coelomomyces lativittatus]KAJ1511209.1 KRRI-Interacting protein 1 [Coelomomyces lativittatus]
METNLNDGHTSSAASDSGLDSEASESGHTSSSDVEDENGDLINPEVDAEVLKTWISLRKKDPKIYDANVKLYNESVFDAAEKRWLEKKNEKKVQQKTLTLSELARKRLEQGVLDSEEEEEDSIPSQPTTLAPVEEKFQLKKEFLNAVSQIEQETQKNGEDENEETHVSNETHAEDEFFSVKKKTQEEVDQEQREFHHEVMASLSKDDAHFLDMFTKSNATPEDEFLLNYILKKGWSEPQTAMLASDETLLDTLDQDAKEIEATEKFEQTYNLRFEQTHLTPCPRHVPDSLRKKNETRKLARQRKVERKRALIQQRIDEIKKEKRLHRKTSSAASNTTDLDLLDFEDVVDGQPVRFSYKQVRPTSFGLTPEEILEAEDEDLNRLVSTRTLAAYNDPNEEIQLERRKKRKLAEFRRQLNEKRHPQGLQQQHDHFSSSNRNQNQGKRRKTYTHTR